MAILPYTILGVTGCTVQLVTDHLALRGYVPAPVVVAKHTVLLLW